jgi:hypothetical protein
MTAMGWGTVWQAASAAFAAEAVEVRLALLVGAAFLVLMILVGLRHTFPFRSAGPVPGEPLPELPQRVFAAAEPVSKPMPQPFRVMLPALRAARKSAKHTISRQRPLRPQIRRAGKPEIDAPYSPLPPRG